jgi:hypothetical protein
MIWYWWSSLCIFYSNGEFFQYFGETIPKPQNSNGDDGICDLDYASSTIVGDLPLSNMVK